MARRVAADHTEDLRPAVRRPAGAPPPSQRSSDRSALMGDEAPSIAVATVYTPGAHDVQSSDAVVGVAVGAPVQQSARVAPPERTSAADASSRFSVAQSFLYSPAMAKVFAQFDTDRRSVQRHRPDPFWSCLSSLDAPSFPRSVLRLRLRSGALELSELTKLVTTLGLSEADAADALKQCDTSGDEKIQLEEWERGLDDRLRTLIEAHLNERGELSNE